MTARARAAWERPLVSSAVLLVLGAALAAIGLLSGIGPHDEGLALQGAQRIADGQWPYADFWTNYVPGQFVLLAVPVKVLGPSLLWWRLIRIALAAIVALLAYRLLARGRGPEWLRLLGWLAVAAAMAWPAAPGPNPPALALVLGGFLLLRRSPVAAGLLFGVAIAFRPEIALAGALGALLVGGGWRMALTTVAAGTILLLPFFVAAPGDMWDDVIGFSSIQDLQRLPLPLHYRGSLDPNKLLEFYFPAYLLAATAGWAVWAAVRRPRWVWGPVPLLVVGVLYLLGRTDEFHLVPLSVVLALVLAAGAGGERVKALRVVLAVAVAVIALHGLGRQAELLVHPPAGAAVPSPVADGVRTAPADAAALRGLLPAIHALTPPGRPIIVLPPRTDRVSVGDPLLYVLAQRPNPTRYDVMQPGIVTTARVQREIVRDLERTRPAVLVRWVDPRAARPEPNGSGRSSGVRLLDRYLAAHYGAPRRFGDYVMLRRLDGAG